MAWLDDRIRDHPKIRKTTPAAFKNWALALCYCSAHGTEGQLDDAIVNLSIPKKHVEELVHIGLWDREDDQSLWVHDWQEHNEKRDQAVEERRSQARERQRRHRERVRKSRVTERDGSVTVTRDDSPHVTRDIPRGGAPAPHAREPAQSRDHDQEEELQAAAARNGVTPDPAAAAALDQRLQDHGITPVAALTTDHERTTAWIDLAESEARDNPAGFIVAGVRSGEWPSPRVRAQAEPAQVDAPARRDRFVRGDGWRLPADELEFQLGEMGADDDELVGLLELAADLRNAEQVRGA